PRPGCRGAPHPGRGRDRVSAARHRAGARLSHVLLAGEPPRDDRREPGRSPPRSAALRGEVIMPPGGPRMVLVLAAALVLGGTTRAGAAASTDKADVVRWRSLAQGTAEAGSSGKPLLYFFTADWCGPCHLMKAEVFSDKELASLIEKEYVPIEITDRTRETGKNSEDVDKLIDTYEVHGFPTLVVTRLKSK